jgi:hypothetical protein
MQNSGIISAEYYKVQLSSFLIRAYGQFHLISVILSLSYFEVNEAVTFQVQCFGKFNGDGLMYMAACSFEIE